MNDKRNAERNIKGQIMWKIMLLLKKNGVRKHHVSYVKKKSVFKKNLSIKYI